MVLFADERWLACIHPGNVHDFHGNDIGFEAWVVPDFAEEWPLPVARAGRRAFQGLGSEGAPIANSRQGKQHPLMARRGNSRSWR
jgi:hypothetical protein